MKELYDKICRTLTDYEHWEDIENDKDIVCETDLYELLVEIQTKLGEMLYG